MCKYFSEKIYIKGFNHSKDSVFAEGETKNMCNKKNSNVDKYSSCSYFEYDED